MPVRVLYLVRVQVFGWLVVSAMLRHSSHKITGDLYASVLPELAAEAPEAVASMSPASGRRETDGHGWVAVA